MTAPMVLDHALSHYGTLGMAEVFAPAIRLAEDGYPLTALQRDLIDHYQGPLRSGSAKSVFLGPDGRPPRTSGILRQPVLGRTLRRLSAAGFQDFYRGEIADAIADDMERHDGFVGREDLAAVPPPRESEPLAVPFLGTRVHTLGPPGGGLALAEMLRLYEAANGQLLDPDSPAAGPLVAAIIRQARRDRRRYRLRTGADAPGEAAVLMTPEYARGLESSLRSIMAGGETSHVSVMDAQDNVVALTQSIERSFGAAEMSPDLGFLYNGFLRAFKVENRRHPHFLRPGAVARSNASPTIVLRDGRPWAALGSTGSERSTSGIFETLLRLFAGRTAFEAVAGPRLHCTPEGEVILEGERFPEASREALREAGFVLTSLGPYAFKMGGIQLCVREGELCTGVADPRRDGAAFTGEEVGQ
jgi:gamma-glutamyltranspeptidase/glutathione hydrolase